MSKITLEVAENLASKLRGKYGFSMSEPISMKTVVRMSGILTMYRPLDSNLYGMSLKSCDQKSLFILVNSNTTRGRQHFTIAHELYHLFYEENPYPHFCGKDIISESERNANMFASAFLMPREGLLQNISAEELIDKSFHISSVLKLESLFGVSHSMLLIRLKELKFITEKCFKELSCISVQKEALCRGFELSLYKCGNEGLVISDFGQKAKQLYDEEKISEGHYWELMNLIGQGYGEGEDSSGC